MEVIRKFLISLLVVIIVLECSVYSKFHDFVITPNIQIELNSRHHVTGAMGGNITLTSNSSIGTGSIGFVLAGEVNGSIPVAIKVMGKFNEYEYNAYKKMDAMTDNKCEKFGVPFIYYSGEFLNMKTLAMTKLDIDLKSLQLKLGAFSKDTLLIINRDMIKTLKFIHSKGIIHDDIKPKNIMTKGANVFLCDFNLAEEKSSQNFRYRGNMRFKSIPAHLGKPPVEYDDLESLFYSMLVTAGVELPWRDYRTSKEMLEYKLRFTEILDLCKQIKHRELVEPYIKFYIEIIASMDENRLPQYDYLYKVFDDAFYDGRNRSNRIVFEWLTPSERTEAITEEVLSIESIALKQTLK